MDVQGDSKFHGIMCRKLILELIIRTKVYIKNRLGNATFSVKNRNINQNQNKNNISLVVDKIFSDILVYYYLCNFLPVYQKNKDYILYIFERADIKKCLNVEYLENH